MGVDDNTGYINNIEFHSVSVSLQTLDNHANVCDTCVTTSSC